MSPPTCPACGRTHVRRSHTTDISLNGCALELATAVPQRPFTLLPHVGDPPIRIESAVARFVAGRAIGVEFRKLTPAARARLAEYVGALFTARQL